jgi:hypothetical protein
MIIWPIFTSSPGVPSAAAGFVPARKIKPTAIKTKKRFRRMGTFYRIYGQKDREIAVPGSPRFLLIVGAA